MALKLLMWGPCLWAKSGYGVGIHNLINGLKQRHEVAMFGFTGLQFNNIDVEGIRVYYNPAPDFGQAWIKHYYEESKADVIIAWFDLWAIGDFIPRSGIASKLIAYQPVDHSPLPPPCKAAVEGCLRAVPYCQFARERYEEAGVKCTEPIQHGVDLKIFKPGDKFEAREALSLPRDKFVFGCNGTNKGPRKNLPNTLRAYRMFLDRNPKAWEDTIFLYHGYAVRDNYNQEGYNLVEMADGLGLKKLFHFPNYRGYILGLNDEEMATWYNACDVLLQTVLAEGFGLPLVEAAACAVPAIGTNFSSIPEVIGPGGLLVDIADYVPMQLSSSWQALPSTEDIARKMEMVYRDRDLLKELGEKAYRHAQQFDWEKHIIPKWERLLDEVEVELGEEKPAAVSIEGVQPWRLGLIPQHVVPERVLDVGCGRNQVYRPYLEKLGEYVGVDIHGDGHKAIKADAQNLPFGDREFGFLWMSEVLEHLDDPQRAVGEAKRVAVHGAIAFSTPFNNNFREDPEHRLVALTENYLINQEGNGIITW